MCGRTRCTVRADAAASACGFQAPVRTINSNRFQPSYNVAPGAHMPVVRHDVTGDAREPVVHCMRWGLVPSFTKKSEKPDFYHMFNARSESVHQKSSFRRLLPKNRCLATVEGFYEWKKDGKKKQPYYVHLEDGRPLVFAALYDSWEDPEGETMYTFTILTTRVSTRLEWLHDRMPVILSGEDSINSWLNDELSEENICKLTQPYEATDLVWYPVTPAMGRPAFNGPKCVEEVKQKVATESKIARMFGRQIAQDTSRSAADRCPEPSKGETLSENEEKALLAGMEPDQDVTEAMHQSRENCKMEIEIPESSHEEYKGVLALPCSFDTQCRRDDHFAINDSQSARNSLDNKGNESLHAESTKKEVGPLSPPMKNMDSKEVSETKNDLKRNNSDNLKNPAKRAKSVGGKQKQSNLLGFFPVQ